MIFTKEKDTTTSRKPHFFLLQKSKYLLGQDEDKVRLEDGRLEDTNCFLSLWSVWSVLYNLPRLGDRVIGGGPVRDVPHVPDVPDVRNVYDIN